MRIALAAAAFAATAAPIAADAQSVRRSGPLVSQPAPQSRPFQGRQPNSGGRWGAMIGGRWYGGVHAPGGWAAYRRPIRGWALPTYWTAPNFVIYDWSSYGLGVPPQGYSWYRYYDDAVLADERGRVYDTRSDMRWDEREEADELVSIDGDADAGAPYPPPPPGPPPVRREYRDVRPAPPPLPRPSYGDRYAYEHGGYHEGYSLRGGYDAPPPAVISTPGGATVVTQSSGGWWGGSSTTVVVQPAVTTTTTTTEYVYETVAAAPHRARKRSWKPRSRVTCCVCKVVCR